MINQVSIDTVMATLGELQRDNLVGIAKNILADEK